MAAGGEQMGDVICQHYMFLKPQHWLVPELVSS